MAQITIQAGALIGALRALDSLKGDRPVMLSRRMNKIREELLAHQTPLEERMTSYAAPDGRVRPDLTEEELAKLNEIINEELTIEVPTVDLAELDDAGITVSDDGALHGLMGLGIITEEK